MRISYWSSDVCSSDLGGGGQGARRRQPRRSLRRSGRVRRGLRLPLRCQRRFHHRPEPAAGRRRLSRNTIDPGRSRRLSPAAGEAAMLKVTYIPVVSEDFAAHLREEAAKIDAAAQVKAEYPDPQGVLEWALPALFVFVVGGISTAVLSEAGKDIYKGLKALVLESYDEASKRSEEHTSELQSLMRNSYAVFCLKKKK